MLRPIHEIQNLGKNLAWHVVFLADFTGLGLGEEDMKVLTENVSVVFHLAATIKFDAPLRSGVANYSHSAWTSSQSLYCVHCD